MSNFATNQNSMNTKKMVVNDWFYQSVLKKHCIDGFRTSNQRQKIASSQDISNWGYNV